MRVFILEGEHTATSMFDDQNFVRAQQLFRDHKGAKRVTGVSCENQSLASDAADVKSISIDEPCALTAGVSDDMRIP